MTEKILYIAFDGEEFEEKSKCLEHEREIICGKGIVFFDPDMHMLNIDMLGLKTAFMQSKYIAVNDVTIGADILEELKLIHKNCGLPFPSRLKAGDTLMYDDNHEHIYIADTYHSEFKEVFGVKIRIHE